MTDKKIVLDEMNEDWLKQNRRNQYLNFLESFFPKDLLKAFQSLTEEERGLVRTQVENPPPYQQSDTVMHNCITNATLALTKSMPGEDADPLVAYEWANLSHIIEWRQNRFSPEAAVDILRRVRLLQKETNLSKIRDLVAELTDTYKETSHLE